MILLELSFEYDDESKVICALKPDHTGLGVLGISANYFAVNSRSGGMVREFYGCANASGRFSYSSFEDFLIDMHMAFRAVTFGGGADLMFSDWLAQINPQVETREAGHDIIKPGTSIRFYHPDGPAGSWVWKDSVKDIRVILKL